MNKEQVEEIIKNIAESGHVLENKTITDTSVSLIYYNCWISQKSSVLVKVITATRVCIS